MKSVNLGKATATIHPNMNKNEIYIDSMHADPIKENVLKQMDVLSKSLVELGTLLNKMAYKNMFLDGNQSVALQCSKKCMTEAETIKHIKSDFDEAYKDDIKMFLIQSLDERISYLEDRVLSNKD